jgi:hypothetical protein
MKHGVQQSQRKIPLARLRRTRLDLRQRFRHVRQERRRLAVQEGVIIRPEARINLHVCALFAKRGSEAHDHARRTDKAGERRERASVFTLVG